eukprot:2976171-Pyramimonas_sp.AAC.1
MTHCHLEPGDGGQGKQGQPERQILQDLAESDVHRPRLACSMPDLATPETEPGVHGPRDQYVPDASRGGTQTCSRREKIGMR